MSRAFSRASAAPDTSKKESTSGRQQGDRLEHKCLVMLGWGETPGCCSENKETITVRPVR